MSDENNKSKQLLVVLITLCKDILRAFIVRLLNIIAFSNLKHYFIYLRGATFTTFSQQIIGG